MGEETIVVEKGTWKFAKQIGKIIIPSTIQTILQSSILTAADQMMLGQLGATNITAVGIAGAYIGLFCMGAGGDCDCNRNHGSTIHRKK